jgi:4-coumarate--CoA ligase
MHLVPPILVTMSFHPAFDKYNMTSLRLLSSGAAPLGNGVVKKVLAKFSERGNTRLKITQRYVCPPSLLLSLSLMGCAIFLRPPKSSYGLTETIGTHWLRVEDSMRKIGSVGWLIPNIQARLVDEDEEDIQPGPELWVRMYLFPPLFSTHFYLHLTSSSTQQEVQLL